MTNTSKLAIDAMRKQIQVIAFDANLFDLGISTNPCAENRSILRKKLLAAIAELQKPPQAQPYLFLDKEHTMTEKTIADRIVEEGLSDNLYAAIHIAEGLHLAQLKTEEEQLERVRRYRVLRNSGFKSKEAYRLAIQGVSQEQAPI